MRRSIAILLLFFSLVVEPVLTASADTWERPKPRLFVSERGTHGFKVLPQQRLLGTSTGVLFTVADDGNDQILWSNKLVNIPHRVFVSQDGKRVVTVDTYANLGFAHSLVVYDDNGAVVADYKLEDLLSENKIRELVPRTVSSRRWADGTSFRFLDGKHFEIIAKAETVITVDLDSGELVKLEFDLRKVGEVDRALRNDPENKDLQEQLLALTKLLARYQPSQYVWETLIAVGGVKDGMSPQEAEALLGPPTVQSRNHVEWYVNPALASGGKNVAASLTAKVTKEGLADWKIGKR